MPRNHGLKKQSISRVVEDSVGKSSAINMAVRKASNNPQRINILKRPPIATVNQSLSCKSTHQQTKETTSLHRLRQRECYFNVWLVCGYGMDMDMDMDTK